MAKSKLYHTPVLLKEVIELLNIQKGKKYIDATVGGGGYSIEILKKGGVVLGIDLDKDAIDYVKENIKYLASRRSGQISNIKIGEQLVLVQGNFREIEKIAHSNGFDNVSGIILDLGLSSYQIEHSGRGFSFKKREPLDMRMDSFKGAVTAAEIINSWRKEELYELFIQMGEEHFSLPIVHNIIRARRIKPIESTLELAKIVEGSIPEKRKIPARHASKSVAGRHPATRVFQALRIAVNDELTNLRQGLVGGFETLDQNGRMMVVSFHSLEDRIVKNYFRGLDKMGEARILTKKAVTATPYELKENIRARSAKGRAIVKI